MFRGLILAFIAVLNIVGFAVPAASDSNPVWVISLLGVKGEALGTMTFELTTEPAKSCLSGEWKKVRVLQNSVQTLSDWFTMNDYYPSYSLDDGFFSIQLNMPGWCDAYRMLTGKLSDHEVSGEYTSDGMFGGTSLGTFTARKQ